MSSISNEDFIIYMKFFLSLTLHYNVGISQILIKKLGIRISGFSSLSAIETSIKPSIPDHNYNHRYLWTTSSVSYKVVLFAELKSQSENLANIEKDCPFQKPILKKVAASRIVSWEFSVTSEDSKVAVDELFSCVLRTMRLLSFVFIATPKIFRIILFPLFISQEILLLAFVSWKP